MFMFWYIMLAAIVVAGILCYGILYVIKQHAREAEWTLLDERLQKKLAVINGWGERFPTVPISNHPQGRAHIKEALEVLTDIMTRFPETKELWIKTYTELLVLSEFAKYAENANLNARLLHDQPLAKPRLEVLPGGKKAS